MPDSTEQLKAQLDTSSSINRNLGLVFVSFLIYVLVIVGGTTDLMLLLPDENIKLPILSVELPIIPFYIVIPFLIIGLHMNLLVNLRQHAGKLQAWNNEITDEKHWGYLLHPFLFNFISSKKVEGRYLYFIRVLVESVIYALPIATLLLIQVRFSDYHAIWITRMHFTLFLFDVYLFFYFSPLINHPDDFKDRFTVREQYQRSFLNLQLFKAYLYPLTFIKKLPDRIKIWLNDYPKKWFPKQAYFVTVMSVLAYGATNLFLTEAISSENHYRLAKNFIHREYPLFQPCIEIYKYDTTVIYGSLTSTLLSLIHKPIIELNEEELVKEAPPIGIQSSYLQKGHTIDEAWLDLAKGISLKGRNLKFANLSKCKLTKADLRYAQLQEATLIEALLQKSNMSFAQMDGINLIGANLQEASLEGSKALGGNFTNVKLNEANCKNTSFKGARFENASIKGTLLFNAQLSGASFYGAEIYNSNFEGAHVQGSVFSASDLSGVNFEFADLRGIYGSENSITGVDFKFADLSGAELHSFIQACNFEFATLFGVDFYGSGLKGCFFTGANLYQAINVNLTCSYYTYIDTLPVFSEYFDILDSCGYLRYSNPKVIVKPTWEVILKDSILIPHGAYRDLYIKGILKASSQKNNIIFNNELNPSCILKYRREYDCESYSTLNSNLIKYHNYSSSRWDNSQLDTTFFYYNNTILRITRNNCPQKVKDYNKWLVDHITPPTDSAINKELQLYGLTLDDLKLEDN